MAKIIGIGPHYPAFLQSKGLSADFVPHLFLKPLSGVIGDGQTIRLPEHAERVMAEVEIAVLINRPLRNAREEELADLSAIGGYAIANDLTAFGPHVMGEGKIYDTFTPLGPFQKVKDPSSIRIESYLNGERKQSAGVEDMGYTFARILAYFSTILTLEAGDIVLTGTPVGPFEINPGDRVEIRSEQLGTVSNMVEA
ncbi:fumarylacetoacetate hydrolase family protein [Paenibacillus rhizophilus]|uniref:Fumarylacetoacetate hydrolase family protein n=1 Tax=Paenibacillus rhizophilus TaxID=1850366 RepID=A0A3N9P1J4_9BACL|nr:fumarylacetoacetate hydrolase family protein [Paenibacillus rhizophilus]RQW09170.1 fumarylacetoacetate hydrolase family protein [Paenibacillus rhizophilus]